VAAVDNIFSFSQSRARTVPGSTGSLMLMAPEPDANFILTDSLKRRTTEKSSENEWTGTQAVLYTTRYSFAPVIDVRSAKISWQPAQSSNCSSLGVGDAEEADLDEPEVLYMLI
jgi:hypothetical protein